MGRAYLAGASHPPQNFAPGFTCAPQEVQNFALAAPPAAPRASAPRGLRGARLAREPVPPPGRVLAPARW